MKYINHRLKDKCTGISGEEVNGLHPEALVGVSCVEEQRQRCINMCSSSSKKNVRSEK